MALNPYTLLKSATGRPPVETALFDMFKVGPGPSSSHTIGPMKAGADFLARCSALPAEMLARAASVHVTLLGSLSATGFGHGTDAAVVAGLLGNEPQSCPAGLLAALREDADTRRCMRLAGREIPVSLSDVEFGPLVHDAPYSNTMRMYLCDAAGETLCEMEYYSVGGGFIQWKGWKAPERGRPVYPYATMRELVQHLHESGLTLHELLLENEMAITGMDRPSIYRQLDEIMEAMCASVRRGLEGNGALPGTLGVQRKAGMLFEGARHMRETSGMAGGMGAMNAYAIAVSEENAAGGVIVTAPTCGSAGVLPSLLYTMRYDMHVGERAIREGLLASVVVGMLAKHNAGIAGAEMGCQGEVGVASSMGAAMLAHALGYSAEIVENAAESALEHHLGLTCDPVGGYVQIPCIERNAMGAVKAFNALLVARSERPQDHLVSLDAAIMAMGEIGREMNAKFKETSEGGLAVSMVEC